MDYTNALPNLAFDWTPAPPDGATGAVTLADCKCCTRNDSTIAKRYLDSFGDALRCWVCWSTDAVRHPLTGEVRYIADRVRNNFLRPGAKRFGYPNAGTDCHAIAPVCFWHNDPNDVANGMLAFPAAGRRARLLADGATYATLLD